MYRYFQKSERELQKLLDAVLTPVAVGDCRIGEYLKLFILIHVNYAIIDYILYIIYYTTPYEMYHPLRNVPPFKKCTTRYKKLFE